ncbi:MAG TPA: DUF4349 domain-containing protein [Gaiellaceae bacterium]|jgi:hypothetical protein
MSANEMTVQSLLRAHPPLAPESLRARVLALEPRRTPSRRLVLVLAVALAIAVAAAIVHGLVSSGNPKQQAAALRHVPSASRKAFAPAVTNAGGGGGALTGSLAAGSAKDQLLPSVGGASTRLQRTEATLEVRVKDVASATTRATQVATSLGGYAQSVNYSSGGSSFIELRVPAQNVKIAISRLTTLGTIVSQNLSVIDLEHDLQAESAQIAELRHTVAALTAALRSTSLPDAQRVILQIRLANAKRALSQRLHARTGTIAAGTNATISLTLSTKAVVVPVPHHRGRLGRMVHSAFGFLGLEGAIALYVLIAVSPFALVAGLLWSLRGARRRRTERLVME